MFSKQSFYDGYNSFIFVTLIVQNLWIATFHFFSFLYLPRVFHIGTSFSCHGGIILYEIECNGEIECYDKINELHPKYPVIIYNHARRYKQRLKKIVSTITVKSLREGS